MEPTAHKERPHLTDGARLTHRPTAAQVNLVRAVLTPWRLATSPRFEGLDNIPTDGPVLLVGNHTLYGLLDVPLMADEIYRNRGRFVRGLAENAHYKVPGWRDVLTAAGAVRGTRDNCRSLLAAGEAVVVFPGGGREVAKRKDEQYRLLWKERMGFARMAIEAGCPIVPFASVGIEDNFDIVIDADHQALTPIREALQKIGVNWDLVPPVATGLGPTPLPRMERLYFSFAEPIDTTRWAGLHDDDTALREVRDLTRTAVEDRIASLQAKQEADPSRDFVARARLRFGLS